MYRRSHGISITSLVTIIIIGVVAGILFVMVDNQQPGAPDTPSEAAISAQITPTLAQQPTLAPTLPPTEGAAEAPVSDVAETAAQDTNTNALLPEIPEGTSLFIPSAGIYAPIVQAYLDGSSWDVSRLGTNVGHLEGTAWFTQPGNVVLSGHVELSDGRQGVFSNLNDLQVNDIIVLNSNNQERRYVITNISSTTPDDLEPVMPTPEDRLTLITCGNYDFFQDAYLERLIVVAAPIS